MKKAWTWVLVIVVILVAVRITLPFVAEDHASKALQNPEGYYGSLKEGYMRLVLENLEILYWDEEKGGFFSKVWAAVAGEVKAVFENPSEDQVATQSPLEGNLNQMNLNAGIWHIRWGLFKNTFVEALNKRTEDAIYFPLKE